MYDNFDIPDRQLIESLRLSRHASKAFETIFTRYSEKIYAFVLSISKERFVAEEVTQNVFIKLWNRREELQSERSLGALLFRMSYNEMVDLFRHRRAEQNKLIRFFSVSTLDGARDTESEIEFENLAEMVERVVSALPERRQMIFRLSREQGLTNAEIALRMGISIKTVENQITQLIKTLRHYLKGFDLFET